MKYFRYRAKKSPTETVEDVIPALSQDEVIAKVNEMGLVVVDVREESGEDKISVRSKAASAVSVKNYRGREKPAVTRFYKQLGRMLESGIPIMRALRLVGEQTESARLRVLIEDFQKQVGEGHPFSQVLQQQPEYFSAFDGALVEAGELVGRLDESLRRIALHREADEKFSSKIRSALAYPAFVIVAGIGAVIFMLSYVMPKFAAFFLNLGQELPLLTRLLIQSSQFAEKTWPITVSVFIAGIWIFKRSLGTDADQIGWHRFYLRLPKVGRLILEAQIARFSRTLSLLLASGIPLLKGVQTSLPVVTNLALRAELEFALTALREGGSFGDSLSRSPHVPLLVVHLIRAGEESGKLQESLNDISDWYEQELQEKTEILTKLLEPILILLIGSMLGVMIVAVLLPVFSMNAVIN